MFKKFFIFLFFLVNSTVFAGIYTPAEFKLGSEFSCLNNAYINASLGNLTITSTVRSFEEQDSLYMKGRCGSQKNEDIVTNAKAGESYHNFGYAFDVVDKSKGYDGTDWEKVGEFGKACGLDWGGDFNTIKDNPHFQVRGKTLSQLRNESQDYQIYIRDNNNITDPCERENVNDIGGGDGDNIEANKLAAEEQLKEICSRKKEDFGLVGYNGVCDEDGFASLLGLIQNALNWVIGLAFLLAVLVLLYAGFVLLTANGQPAKRTQALHILRNVIIGLFFISASWLLVDWIFRLFAVNDNYKLIGEIVKKIWII